MFTERKTEEAAGGRCQEATGTRHSSHLLVYILGISSVPGTMLGSTRLSPRPHGS